MVQKPNFLYNPLLMATPVGGASFPSIANLFIIESCNLEIELADVNISFNELCQVSGPAKIPVAIIELCNRELSYDFNIGNTISESVLVTLSA